MNMGTLQGSNSIYFVADTSLSHIILHSMGLKIIQVTCQNLNLKFKELPEEEKLVVDGKFMAGDTSCITITYEYINKFERAKDRLGIYYFKKENEVLENLLYTMSEPSDARCWYPCWDEPNDKVLTNLHVRVNKGYSVASNGLLLKTEEDSDSTTIFHWQTNYPITTYLVSIVISKFSHFSHYYHKITNPNDSLEIVYYVWPPDSNGVIFNAVKAFSRVSEMIKAYAGIFGEYPFEKYGMATVYPFNFGGEEHQTMTTVHRYWLYGEDMGIAHELAHQWWGDMITCATWKDIWLNESFATYSEYLWLESRTKDVKELKKKIESFERFGPDWAKAVYDPEGQGLKLFSDIVYQKGALVLHTLRNIIGDDKFFEILHEYRKKYNYSYADTKKFIDVVNSVMGEDYTWFFDQYIFGKGYPQIKCEWTYDESQKTLNVTLEQIQPDDNPIFKLPLEIKIISNTLRLEKIYMDGFERKQIFKFLNIENPLSVEVDPDKKVFLQVIKNK